MQFEDIICFQYSQGVRDNDLRKDLSSVKKPDLVKFNLLLDADIQTKITVQNMSCSIPSSSFHTPSQSSKKGEVCNQRPTSTLSDEEKRRRKTFKGRCYRCGSSEHMQPAYKLPSNIMCNVCHQVGHISPVCSQSAYTFMLQQDSAAAAVQPPSFPAIQCMPDGAASSSQQAGYTSASAYIVNSSLPTLELPL